MKNALDLLIEVTEESNLLSHTPSILFLNGQDVDMLSGHDVTLYQPFKPLAPLQNQNPALSGLPPSSYDIVLIMGTKHVRETRHYIAKGLAALKPGGTLLISADNKENGKRFVKWFQELGLTAESFSGNKAKCALVEKTENIVEPTRLEWEAEGAIQKNNAGFFACPGLFSWDRIDAASQLLLETIHEPLSGHGADFGCGYGYLSQTALKKYPKIKSLDGYDADMRALDVFQQNTDNENIPINTFWEDLGSPLTPSKLYDFILMNPPFHEGRQDTPALGLSFIQNAAKSLKRKGVLWMVANQHLPYEQALTDHFFKVEKQTEQSGFKVFRAEK